jgi:glycosyltransferase involved in cell wall biosynthesis
MRILFIHQNFPAQFVHLSAALAKQGHEVIALGINPIKRPIAGVTYVQYRPARGNGKDIHPWAIDFETKVLRADACAGAAKQLRDKGWNPDVLINHSGWGESWFLRELWPRAKMLSYFEYYFRPKNSDIDFDPEFPVNEQMAMRLRVRNASNLVGLDLCDVGISPMPSQKATYPAVYQHKLRVIHEGVDTDRFKPNAQATMTLAGGLRLTQRDEVVTYAARNLESTRGWHTFARSLPRLLAQRPNAQVVVVGGRQLNYAAPLPSGQSHFDRYWNEVKDQVDTRRVHFVGFLSHEDLMRVMQVSRVHVYLTYPFVLSWSMLEAMSMGALVLGSQTSPVEEVITHGSNGLLVDFFDVSALADAVSEALHNQQTDPNYYSAIRAAARQTVVERFDLKRVCLPQQLALVDELLADAASLNV